MDSLALIVPAAGRSIRFGAGRSKLLENLRGQTVISRALQPFLARSDLIKIIIPCTDSAAVAEAIASHDPRITYCPGGANRAESVYAGLKEVPAEVEWVAIHDAARPLISAALIESTFAAAKKYGAAVPALPAALTIKQATGPLPAKVERTLPRHTLWTMQTPQIMRRADLLKAYSHCPLPLDQVTDDVQLLELIGQEVWLIPGEECNLKITTAADIRVAEMWCDAPS